MQPIREAVSYRGLFTAGWFDVREKHCSWLEIYNRLRASEQADDLHLINGCGKDKKNMCEHERNQCKEQTKCRQHEILFVPLSGKQARHKLVIEYIEQLHLPTQS